MFRKVKFIVITDSFGNECPIIFPETIIHKDMAMSQKRMMGNSCKILSGGFVNIEDSPTDIEYSTASVNHKLFAYGESESLGLKAREEDTELLNRMFYGREDK
jgi:hypothetical protein